MRSVVALLLVFPALAFSQTNRSFKPYVPPPAPTAAPIGKTNEIQIIKVLSVNHPYVVCQTSVGQVYMVGLSPQLMTLQQRVANLDKSTTAEAAKLKEDWKQYKRESAAAPSSASVGTVGAAKIQNLNIRLNRMEERDDALEEALSELKSARLEWSEKSEVTAFDTGRKYGSYSIWSVIPSRK